MNDDSLILGIESSCDETAAAIVGMDGTIHAQALLSQVESHAPYGGVVPEIAARQHIQHIEPLIEETLRRSQLSLGDIDALAVTAGPGLIGGVIVGVMTAKAIALVQNIPLYAINHLEGHALSVRLSEGVAFPYLLFLMSGGHCQLLLVHGVGRYELLGRTLDDAIGEAFDKTAKMMGLGYPGGPAIQRYAERGNPQAHTFPRPYLDRPGCDMSFSGLKTAVRTRLLALETAHGRVSEQDKADIAASLQETLAAIVADRLDKAAALCRERGIALRGMVIAGGVAANTLIRQRLQETARAHDCPFIAPPVSLCTDNAAMIAWAAIERIREGIPPDSLTVEPRARWPLYGEDVPRSSRMEA